MSPNPFAWSFRAQMLFGAVACFALIAYALHVQYNMLMMPCPLCILQRVAFAAMGVVGLAAAAHNPRGAMGRRIYALLVFLFAAIGAGIAARHLWMQAQPADFLASCNSMSLDFMLDAMPLLDVLRTVLTGSGECGKVDWSLFGIAMPGWTLACYVLLGLGALVAGFRRR